MLETAVVIFREGLEMFLIVAIMLAYVTNTGRAALRKPIYAGVAVAGLISVTTGWHVAELAQDPMWEGTLAIAAGILVASFTIYIMRTAKNIRGDIHRKLEERASKEGFWADAGVFIFTVLMIAREGMETAMMLGAMTGQYSKATVFGGMFFGLCTVGVIGYLWMTQSSKINLRLFLQVTGIFLVLFSVHLFLLGLHELSEMNLIPMIGDDANISFHIATEDYAEGPYADVLTALMLFIPLAWLGGSYLRDKLGSKKNAPSLSAAE